MRYLRANAKVYADITEQQTLSIPKKVTYSYADENYSATRYSGWSNRYAMMVGVSTFIM